MFVTVLFMERLLFMEQRAKCVTILQVDCQTVQYKVATSNPANLITLHVHLALMMDSVLGNFIRRISVAIFHGEERKSHRRITKF